MDRGQQMKDVLGKNARRTIIGFHCHAIKY